MLVLFPVEFVEDGCTANVSPPPVPQKVSFVDCELYVFFSFLLLVFFLQEDIYRPYILIWK